MTGRKAMTIITNIAVVGIICLGGMVALPKIPATPIGASKPWEEGCDSSWVKCKTATDLVNKNHNAHDEARHACEVNVNSRAKYSEPKWPHFWSDGGSAFNRFYIGPFNGAVTLYESRIQMQNGFGAWANVIVKCTYSFPLKQVIDADIQQR